MGEDRVIIHPRQATGNTKFDLVMRTRELHELEKVLQSVQAMKGKDRAAWVKANGEVFSQAYELFLADTSQTLEGLSMDDEILALSQELVASLRDTSELLDGLVSTRHRLQS